MIRICKKSCNRVSQGDIYRNVEFIESINEDEGVVEIRKILFPFAVVLTQDCDLAQDYTFRTKEQPTQDKLIISVLMAPMYNSTHFFAGEHLSLLDIKSQLIPRGKTPGKNITSNDTPRYHYLEFPDEVPLVTSVIDFKHYFSVTVDHLMRSRERSFVCQIGELSREDISHRFATFLSRIALPS